MSIYLTVIAETRQPLRAPEILPDEVESQKGSIKEIFLPPYRSRTIMMIVFNLLQSMVYYGFASWVPTLLLAQGINVTKSLEYTFAVALTAPVGPMIARRPAPKITARLGRASLALRRRSGRRRSFGSRRSSRPAAR